MCVPLVVVMGLLFGREWAFLVVGAWAGSFFAMLMIVPEMVDGRASRLVSGADAESNTAHELRRLERAGWRSVHNLHFQSGDVDHVAIGPGGVVVIETKSSSADWNWLCGQGNPAVWAKQASRGAVRVQHLTLQRAKIDVTPIAVLAVWVAGQPEKADRIGDVVRVRGKGLCDYLSALPRVLGEAETRRIHAALSEAGEQFDEYVGVTHPGFLGRFLSP
jgi:hypothetical protein